MPLAVCQQEENPMISEKLEKPLLLIVDTTPTFPLILTIALRRAGCQNVEIVSFQKMAMATFWLSGKMDQTKAAKYPFMSPWDTYPALRLPTLAVVHLAFPAHEHEEVLDRLYCFSRTTKIMTTSTKEELLALENHWDEVYWKQVVSHLPRPVTIPDMVERVTALLCLGGQL
jgi:hypothetical protein